MLIVNTYPSYYISYLGLVGISYIWYDKISKSKNVVSRSKYRRKDRSSFREIRKSVILKPVEKSKYPIFCVKVIIVPIQKRFRSSGGGLTR